MADIDAPLAWRMQQDGYLMQINQLRDENAELRAEVERLKRDEWGEGFNAGCDAVNAAIEDGVEYYKGEISRLVSENAELRELCRSMYINYAAVGIRSNYRLLKEYCSIMRELGIELDK